MYAAYRLLTTMGEIRGETISRGRKAENLRIFKVEHTMIRPISLSIAGLTFLSEILKQI